MKCFPVAMVVGSLLFSGAPAWAGETALGSALKTYATPSPTASTPNPIAPAGQGRHAESQEALNATVQKAVAEALSGPVFRKAVDAAVARALASRHFTTPDDVARIAERHIHKALQTGLAANEVDPPSARTPTPTPSVASTGGSFFSIYAPLDSGSAQGALIDHASRIGFKELLASTAGDHPGVYIGRFDSLDKAFAALKRVRAIYSGQMSVLDSDGHVMPAPKSNS